MFLIGLLIIFLTLTFRVRGQLGSDTDIPIILDGALDDATVVDDTYNSAGTITVNGWTVDVPQNMIVTFPNLFVPWPEFVAQKDLFLGWEVNVAGNIVNDTSLAAQIYLWEFALEVSQGYITEINFDDGTMQIQNGPVIRVNDPNGVFGAASDGGVPFFKADDESPSVMAFSGFPMCIPRSESGDELCPSSNRPAGQFNFQAPDPLVMVPFAVGDFVSYSGVKNAAGEIVCYEIVAMNVQVTTTGNPSYIRVEEALVGVYTDNGNAEIQETRFIGYTSDPNAVVSISALVLDPCTGQETEQALGVGQFRPDGGGRNKFTARIDGTTFVDYAREYRLTLSTGTSVTKNNLTVGQYVQPVLEWVQPELLTVGIPPIPNQFAHMTHLTQGIAWDERTQNFFGPLVPFPQSGVSVYDTSTCAGLNGSEVPVATLSAAILSDDGSTTSSTNSQLFVRPGDSIRMSGSQANPNIAPNSTLEWTWGLVVGDSVGTLDDLVNFTTSASGTTFEAEFPSTAGGAPTGDYLFQLNITASSTATSPINTTVPGAIATGSATIKVTLFSGADTVSVDSVTWTSAQSGTIGVICSSNYFVDEAVGMTVQVPGVAGSSVMSSTPPNSGVWSYSSRSVDEPGTVVCRSRLGGLATQVGVTT